MIAVAATGASFTVPYAIIVVALVWTVISTCGRSSSPVEHPSGSGPPTDRSGDVGGTPIARSLFNGDDPC